MARLVIEDSEDEFPDLDELLRAKSGAVKEKEAVAARSRDSGEAKRKSDGNGNGNEKEGSESVGVAGLGKKKRVLKRRDDNPLLRPLAGTSVVAEERRGKVVGKTKTSFVSEKEVKIVGKGKAVSRVDENEVEDETVPRRRRMKAVVVVDDSEDEEEVVPSRQVQPKASTIDFDLETEDDDDLSDFIVNDSTFLEEEVSEIEMPPPPKPPRSVRKLVKGRKPERGDEALEIGMRGLAVQDDQFERIAKEFGGSESEEMALPRRNSKEAMSKPTKEVPRAKKKALEPSSDIEDPFTLRFSPSENKPRKVSKTTHFTTPPGSPELKPKTLLSPKKVPRIPISPHRPSMDNFWSQDVVNDWNEEYSPPKKLQPRPKPQLDPPNEALLFSPAKKSPTKPGRLAKDAKKAFSEKKHTLATSFLTELDNKITSGQISRLASSTGGIQIIWSKKLNTTAGRANWKRETIRSSTLRPDGKPAAPTHRHHASIELAEKVIDDEDRLLNVIAHEFCHLANFMISNIKTNPHGKEFKAWATKTSTAFAHRGINVTTKHSYAIDYKYVWECENCGLEFKRHSKSIDPKRHQCGACKSRLVQTKPMPRAIGAGVNEYQVFVRENMGVVREENPGSPQKVIMGLVGKRYQEFKASRLREVGKEKESLSVSVEEVVGVGGSKEVTPGEGDEVGMVVRKLDFLDLTRW